MKKGGGEVMGDVRYPFPAYLFQVKSPAESKGKWDDYKLFATTPAEVALHPLNPKCSFPKV